jgi:dolichyl-phosphate-mannose--protein O-mannosyl transferase
MMTLADENTPTVSIFNAIANAIHNLTGFAHSSDTYLFIMVPLAIVAILFFAWLWDRNFLPDLNRSTRLFWKRR